MITDDGLQITDNGRFKKHFGKDYLLDLKSKI